MSTLAELTTEVAEEIGSIDATADQTKIWRFLNRGVRDFLRRTKCYVESDVFTPSAAANYTLDSSALMVIDLYFTGSSSPLERVSVPEINRLRRGAVSVGAAFPRFYAFQNPLVMFDVAPSGSATLTCVNVPAPTAMSSALNDPSAATYGGIPVDYHDAIAYYAEWHLASFDDDASSSQGARYREWYLDRVKDCRREIVGRGSALLPKASSRNRTFVRSARDIY
jgi:hypothetical protein